MLTVEESVSLRWLYIAGTRAWHVRSGIGTALYRKLRSCNADVLFEVSLRAPDPLRSRLKPRPSPNRSMDVDLSPFWMMARHAQLCEPTEKSIHKMCHLAVPLSASRPMVNC